MRRAQYMSLIKQAGVDSSWLSDAIYENGGILVTLKNGMKYFYENVPKNVFEQFSNSSSKGTFLNREIKPNYKHKQL